jgi:hypothetical protein
MVKVTRSKETGKITRVRLSDVVFSYAYLISPRPEDDFKAGTYGAELLFDDTETLAAVKEYLKEVMDDAKENTWKGKVPKDLHLPLSEGDEEKDLEAGMWKIKTTTKKQPQLFIKPEGSSTAHEVDEDELDEIYSGMIGDAIITFRAYNYNNIKGITAYLNAVCKTGEGTVLSARVSYEDEFSDGTDFDDDEDETEDALANLKPKESTKAKASTTKKTTTKKATKKVEPEEDEEEEEISLDSLIKG